MACVVCVVEMVADFGKTAFNAELVAAASLLLSVVMTSSVPVGVWNVVGNPGVECAESDP